MNHLVPKEEQIIVYYTDSYSIIEKKFSVIEYAQPFIDNLLKNPDFHLVQIVKRTETKIKVD